MSMLYGILLRQGAPARGEGAPPPPPLASHALDATETAARLLLKLARQHTRLVQNVLGQEGVSLEFRHIAGYLIWLCSHHK